MSYRDLAHDTAPPLSDFELDELIKNSPAKQRRTIERLCAELLRLRNQAESAQQTLNQEVTW